MKKLTSSKIVTKMSNRPQHSNSQPWKNLSNRSNAAAATIAAIATEKKYLYLIINSGS